MAGQPPWSADQGLCPSIKPCAQGAHGTPLARVLPVLLRVLLPSALFALVLLQVHKKIRKKYFLALHPHLHFICTSCLPSSLCKNVFVVVLLPHKNNFVVHHHPQERFCGVLSPTRTIFVRGNHAPEELLTLRWLTLIFHKLLRNHSEFWLCL